MVAVEHKAEDTTQITAPHQESLRKTYFRKLWVALVIIVINLVVMESIARFVAALGKPEQSRSKAFDFKYQLAQKPVEKAPAIFFMGDSVMDFAIYPELLEARLKEAHLNVDARNLAIPSADPMLNLFLLKTAIRHKAKPRLIVYNFYPRNFNQSFIRKTDNRFLTQSYLWRCFEKENRTFLENTQCTLENHLFIVRYRSFFKRQFNALGEIIFNPEGKLSIVSAGFPEREVSPKGWSPGYAVYSTETFHQKFYKMEPFYKTSESELGNYQWTDTYFRPFLDYCKSEKIPVILVWPPEHPIINDYYRKVGLSHDMLSKMAQRYAAKENIDFLDFDAMKSRPYQFVNLDHVNTIGTIALTESFSNFLSTSYRDLLKPVEERAK